MMEKEKEKTGRDDEIIEKDGTGISDKAIEDEDDDTLEISRYVDGFVDFIGNCETPITVSIQGEWGSGKTSFMKLVRNKIKENKDIKYIEFSTWMYNVIEADSSLPIVFLKHFIDNIPDDEIEEEKEKQEKEEKKEEGKKIKTSLKKALEYMLKAKLSVNIVPGILNTSIELQGKNEENVEKREEDTNNKEAMESAFFKEIENAIKILSNLSTAFEEKERLIFFIDDLDRVNPKVAIEILEIIKTLLNIPGVVFVIAIDMDVVKQGVKQKYGDVFSDEKAETYFDKMIQVSYTIPIESYNKYAYFQHRINISREGQKSLKELIDICVDPIPRKMKKIINNFFLSKAMYENHLNKEEDTHTNEMLFALTCLREKYFEYYVKLIQNGDNLKKFLKDSIEDSEFMEQEDYIEISECLLSLPCIKSNNANMKSVLSYFKTDTLVVKSRERSGERKLYNYKGKLYNAKEYTNIYKETFIEKMGKFLGHNSNVDIMNDIIGDGKVATILRNTITHVCEANMEIQTISSSKGKTLVFNCRKANDRVFWRNNANIETVEMKGNTIKYDIAMSRKDAYELGVKILEQAKPSN